MSLKAISAVVLASFGLAACAQMYPHEESSMSFFVTSQGPGRGGDLGGLAGADAYCAKLAGMAGAGGKAWHAYLSTDTVDARIGSGPWYNAKGVMVAASVEQLHGHRRRRRAQAGHVQQQFGSAAPLARPLAQVQAKKLGVIRKG